MPSRLGWPPLRSMCFFGTKDSRHVGTGSDAVGVPIVVANGSGLAPMVEQTRSGIVTQPAVPALVVAVDSILGDRPRARRMGERGRQLCTPISACRRMTIVCSRRSPKSRKVSDDRKASKCSSGSGRASTSGRLVSASTVAAAAAQQQPHQTPLSIAVVSNQNSAGIDDLGVWPTLMAARTGSHVSNYTLPEAGSRRIGLGQALSYRVDRAQTGHPDASARHRHR